MKGLTRIFLLCCVLTAFPLLTAAYAGGGELALSVPSAPTVGGRAIVRDDLKNLTEISVPVSVSAASPARVAVSVPFYDRNGKFVGMGFAAAVADSGATSVAVAVGKDVSGAESLRVLIADADFRPLCATPRYDIPAFSGGDNDTPILKGGLSPSPSLDAG